MTPDNSLVDLLSEEQDDSDDIPTLFQHSPYYDNEAFIEILKTKSDSFSLLSLNCCSLNAKFDQLQIYVDMIEQSGCKLDAICLQETWLSHSNDVSLIQLAGYNLIYRESICSTHGGVAIYLRENFEFSEMPSYGHADIWDGQFLEIHDKNDKNLRKLVIGNIYRPPRNSIDNYTTFTNELNEILYNFSRTKKEVVIVGDFNLDLLKIHSNDHIKEYFECILSNGFLPKITLPTHLTNRQGTLIDNIFTKLSHNFSQSTAGVLWHSLSDHQPCFITLDNIRLERAQSKLIKMYTKSRQSLENFRQEIFNSCHPQNFNSTLTQDPNINYDILDSNIASALKKHLPIKNVKYNKHKHRKTKWITNGILKSIKYRDRLYADLKMTDINDNSYAVKKINLTTYNSILKRSIRLAKKNYYHTCFENFKDDIKKTWSSINGILNKTSVNKKKDFPKFFIVRGEHLHDHKEIANEFNQYFATIGSNLSRNVIPPQGCSFERYLRNPISQTFKFNLINRCDVLKLINSLKPKTSSGIDGLTNKLLRFIGNEVSDCFSTIINQSFTTGIFPDKLKIAKVIPLHKKSANNIFDNYRPISLLPCLSKIIEKSMHQQIQEYFEKFSLFYNGQYGFRAEHSTELAALEVTDQILFQMDNNKTPINIYMDLSKAFDCLQHNILLSKLSHYGFRNTSLQLMASYLSDRKQMVQYDETPSDFVCIDTGVPQGSILGPLLFLIYINDIVNATNSFRPTIYADDTTLGACLSHFGRNNQEIRNNINNELNAISDWLKVNKLSLNAQKTKAMIFHTPKKRPNFPNLEIDQVQIEYVKNFNYLGIIFDNNMTWKNHVEMIRKKLGRICCIINRLKHFLPKDILLMIYNTLVLPHINYGVLLWGCRANELINMQKKLVRNITCSKYNAHSEPILKQLKLLKTTHIHVLNELKFCYKLEKRQLPPYFLDSIFRKNHNVHRYSTRTLNNYWMPGFKHEYFKTCLRYRIPHTFNTTDKMITTKIHTHSFKGYKNYIKNNFLSSYMSICEKRKCYPCGRI